MLALLSKPIESLSATDWGHILGSIGFEKVGIGASLIERLHDIAVRHSVDTVAAAIGNPDVTRELSDLYRSVCLALKESGVEEDQSLIHICPHCGGVSVLKGEYNA